MTKLEYLVLAAIITATLKIIIAVGIRILQWRPWNKPTTKTLIHPPTVTMMIFISQTIVGSDIAWGTNNGGKTHLDEKGKWAKYAWSQTKK